MDGQQFDALLRSLTHSRRTTVLSTMISVGGLAGIVDVEARKKRKKKKRCRGCAVCTSCVKGKCQAVPNFTPCGGVCQECTGGQCVNKAAGTACNGDGQCLSGICNPKPQCISAGVSGCTAMPNCCSGICGPGVGGVCSVGAAGTQCKTNLDCTGGACIGYRCQ